jgi:hypothetical protein
MTTHYVAEEIEAVYATDLETVIAELQRVKAECEAKGWIDPELIAYEYYGSVRLVIQGRRPETTSEKETRTAREYEAARRQEERDRAQLADLKAKYEGGQ